MADETEKPEKSQEVQDISEAVQGVVEAVGNLWGRVRAGFLRPVKEAADSVLAALEEGDKPKKPGK